MEIIVNILQIICIIIGILAGLFVLELVIVAFMPGVSVPKQPLIKPGQTASKVNLETPS